MAVIKLLMLVSLAFAAPYEDLRNFLVGISTGFLGDPGDLYYKCLPDTFQYEMQEDHQRIWKDYDADKSITTVIYDFYIFADDLLKIYDTCNIYVYPHALVSTILKDGPLLIMKFLIHFETIAKDFYDAIETYSSDPTKAGTYLGDAMKQFLLPYKPSLFGEEAPELAFNILNFNVLEFSEGFITGLQSSASSTSNCLKQFKTAGSRVNTFLLQTIKCFTLDFGSCIGIGLVGDDVVDFFETIEGDCKMVEFINKVSNDLSYSGLYNVTYNYYWHMSEINDEVLDIRTAFEKEEWFQLGSDIGSVLKVLLDFEI